MAHVLEDHTLTTGVFSLRDTLSISHEKVRQESKKAQSNVLWSLPPFATAPVSALLGCCSFYVMTGCVSCLIVSFTQRLGVRLFLIGIFKMFTLILGLLKLSDSGSPEQTPVLPRSGGEEQKAVGDRVIGLKSCGVNRVDGVRNNAAKWHIFTVVGM